MPERYERSVEENEDCWKTYWILFLSVLPAQPMKAEVPICEVFNLDDY